MARYLDNAATTRVLPAVAELMHTCLVEDFGNPSSLHAAGRQAAERIELAREEVLAALGGDGSLIFTSGGTEADVLGILGARGSKSHIVTTALEHPAVVDAARRFARHTVVQVTASGVVDPEAMAAAIGEDTTVVACMLVQNELGTVLPVADVVAAVRERRPYVHFHCDAVQALGKVAIDADALGVDSLAVSAHKLGGPKGTGALWVAPGRSIEALQAGGGQEHGLRGGTENVAGIAGFGLAAKTAVARLPEIGPRLAALQGALIDAMRAGIPEVLVLGDGAPRVPHIVSFGFPGMRDRPLVAALEDRGILVSAGSACHGTARSHVLDAIRAPEDVGVVRVSLGPDTTPDDCIAAAVAIIHVILEEE